MGIRTRRAVYIADTGRAFELDQMSPSHILNVISHHKKQIEVLKDPPGHISTEYLLVRLSELEDTVNILYAELSKRDPKNDETGEDEDYEY